MREIDWRKIAEEREMRIRTRGPIRRTQDVPTAIRTRGGIRTRGTVAVTENPLEELVVDLHRKSNGSSIAVLIYGWDEKSAQAFLKAILPLLAEDDVIWLVPPKNATPTEVPAELPGAVILDLSRDTDVRTYNNIVVDIVFFPDGEPEDVDKWSERAEVIIINSSVKLSSELMKTKRYNKQDMYRWSDSRPDKLVGIW